MSRMKFFVLAMLGGAATLAAQQPVPAVPVVDTIVPLDRIVAVVGTQPITQYDLQERVLALQQNPNFQRPSNEAEFERLVLDVLNQLVDEEILVQKANALGVEILDAELSLGVDNQLEEIRNRFPSEVEFRAELQKAGLGTPEEYRRFLTDAMRRTELQRRVVEKLRSEGKVPPVNVQESEVEEAFNRSRATLPRQPATVTFRQIVIAPRPTAAASARAKARADSLLAEINAGGDFERIARRESADSGSREQGGDLGWHRRGVMVPEFERWMFALRPGQVSPVVQTVHGYHIIRVDRVQPGEVKVRHILVKPVIDSADVARARADADTAAAAWRAGAAFDSLARRYHDFAGAEETSILTPIPVDSGLPESYRQAFAGKQPNDVVVFDIAGPTGTTKFVVAQLITVDPGGEYSLEDLRERVRAQLVDEGSIRRLLDTLREEAYVSIRLDEVMRASGAPPPSVPY